MQSKKQIILIGGGIMSATLAALLKNFDPEIRIVIFEKLNDVALESSDAMNNAGTGHSAFCELNYTPQNAETGEVDCSKAIKIAAAFEYSKEFWSHLAHQKWFDSRANFIQSVPHISFVWGAKNVDFLRKRYDLLTQNSIFKGMEWSQDATTLEKWMPLVMRGRAKYEPVAATKMDIGTDINFGELTRGIFSHLEKMDGVHLHLGHEVRDLKKLENGGWKVIVHDPILDKNEAYLADFVFVGAGGGALPLLQKSDILEAEGYGGFPISGQWLVCKNPEIVAQHSAKVYGKAAVGAPPMSVPHLDTRMILGKKALLFGPFAGFSTKFMKTGSYLDLPKSLELDNLLPMISAGLHNIDLTKYLIEQVAQSPEDRMAALRDYFPEAKMEDWALEIAGQRVQVIKKGTKTRGVLEFGTELVVAGDGSLAGLLGASPGASTAVSAMIDLLKKCFKAEMASPHWRITLKRMVPSLGLPMTEARVQKTRAISAENLKI